MIPLPKGNFAVLGKNEAKPRPETPFKRVQVEERVALPEPRIVREAVKVCEIEVAYLEDDHSLLPIFAGTPLFSPDAKHIEVNGDVYRDDKKGHHIHLRGTRMSQVDLEVFLLAVQWGYFRGNRFVISPTEFLTGLMRKDSAGPNRRGGFSQKDYCWLKGVFDRLSGNNIRIVWGGRLLFHGALLNVSDIGAKESNEPADYSTSKNKAGGVKYLGRVDSYVVTMPVELVALFNDKSNFYFINLRKFLLAKSEFTQWLYSHLPGFKNRLLNKSGYNISLDKLRSKSGKTRLTAESVHDSLSEIVEMESDVKKEPLVTGWIEKEMKKGVGFVIWSGDKNQSPNTIAEMKQQQERRAEAKIEAEIQANNRLLYK